MRHFIKLQRSLYLISPLVCFLLDDVPPRRCPILSGSEVQMNGLGILVNASRGELGEIELGSCEDGCFLGTMMGMYVGQRQELECTIFESGSHRCQHWTSKHQAQLKVLPASSNESAVFRRYCASCATKWDHSCRAADRKGACAMICYRFPRCLVNCT